MKWFRRLFLHLREQWTLAGIYNAHKRARSANPWLDTVSEVHYRSFILEAFRDEASAAYLHNGQDLEESKKAFIKARLGARTSAYDRQTTALLRNVVTSMTHDDAFHPEALARYNDEIDAFVQDVTAEHRRRFGRGHHPLVTRVLRGRA